MNSKRKLSLKTLSLTAIMFAVVILSGCSTPQIVENKKAHNNVELLNDLKNQKTITVETVKHVQNLDTRSNIEIKNEIITQLNKQQLLNNLEEDLRQQAYFQQYSDVGTTFVGISKGATEANPLGLAILPLKYIFMKRIDNLKNQKNRIEGYHKAGFITNFAVSNNYCIILAIITGGSIAPICPFVGVLSAKIKYDENIQKISMVNEKIKNKK